MIDPAIIAAVSGLVGLTGVVVANVAALARDAARPTSDWWSDTWPALPADVRAWVAEQYVAVELPPPSMSVALGRHAYAVTPTRPSPIETERR